MSKKSFINKNPEGGNETIQQNEKNPEPSEKQNNCTETNEGKGKCPEVKTEQPSTSKGSPGARNHLSVRCGNEEDFYEPGSLFIKQKGKNNIRSPLVSTGSTTGYSSSESDLTDQLMHSYDYLREMPQTDDKNSLQPGFQDDNDTVEPNIDKEELPKAPE